MARAATSPELALFRTPGQWSKLRAAIFQPDTIYTARINQTFTTTDGILEITYDAGSGTLANVLPDMTLLIGSSAGAHDVGICRIRSVDATKFYISETADIDWADNLYLTVINEYSLWAKHVLIDGGVSYMDGGIEYDDQHTDFDPIPIMGGHRVLKLTGATVSATYNFASSSVYGSTITGYAVSAPGSSASSGMTTATPTITWNAAGWYLVYLTLTAANGKSFFGVRYVYVWDDNNQPANAEIGECRQDAETGGWQFSLRLFDNVTLADVRDRSLVILFAEDHYGTTEQSIGPVTGCENIVVSGWISGDEEIHWDSEFGQVEFTAYTAQYWLSRIPAFPDGVEFVTVTPAAWTEMKNLTVDRGVWHFLHWRTTATRVMDCFLTGDTKYTTEVSSLASNLWEQVREMAFLQIFARPGVNAHNQLFIEVHPQLVPDASRTWPTVMTITKPDWSGEISISRSTVTPAAIVNLSGVAVNSSGIGSPYFSLSPGHAYPHYGSLEVVDRILLSSQAQSNTLAGLYRAWLNNPYPNIRITLCANNRLIDCFPRQKCAIAINVGDTPRGIAYSGALIPVSVAYLHDVETGYLHTEVSFEAVTTADVAINGDVPGSADRSNPPTPPFPPLPDIPIVIPGGGIPDGTDGGPPRVIVHDPNMGLLYSSDFDSSSPSWMTINAGLTTAQYQNINWIGVTPSGGLYVARRGIDFVGSGVHQDPFIAYAPSIGATFVIVEDISTIAAKHAGTMYFVSCVGINALNGQVAYIIGAAGSNTKIYIGTGVTFAAGAVISGHNTGSTAGMGSLSYGFGAWLHTGWDTNPASNVAYWRISADASSVSAVASMADNYMGNHIRASTTDLCFHFPRFSQKFKTSTGNGAAFSAELGDGLVLPTTGLADYYIACDPTGTLLMARWDTGLRGKSSDGGTTWSALSSLVYTTQYKFAYAGGAGTSSRWLAVYSYIWYSDDFGTTWASKEGNLLTIVPLPVLDIVCVVEY